MSLLSFSFLFSFLYFLLAIFVAFYIPGSFFISRLKLTRFQSTILSFLLGVALLGWQGFILGYLKLRFLTYLYLVIFLFFWAKRIKFNFKLPKLKLPDKTLILIIVFGMISQLLSVFFMGILTNKGYFICCGDPRDNILQISYTNAIVKNFPPIEPGLYGQTIKNYHYWSSLTTAELVRVFNLPLIPTNYQFMTVFLSLFLGLSAIVFSELLKLGRVFTRWLVFFLYFGSDLVWVLVTVLRGRDFFAMKPLESGQQFLQNLPRSFSIVLFFAFLSLFILWIKKRDKYSTFSMLAIASSLIVFKVYVGILALSGLGVLGIYYLLKKKYSAVIPLIFVLSLSLIVYFPVNSGAGGLYYTGFWRIQDFAVQGYLGNLSRLELARLVYLQHHSWLRVLEYELIFLAIYLFATFGTKLIGLFQNKKSLSKFPFELNILLISGILVSFILGMFFNQVSGGPNTFNFLAAVFIIGSVYAALSCWYFLKDKGRFLKWTIIFVIFIFTLPRSVNQVTETIQLLASNKIAYIDNQEIEAIKFLNKQKNDSLMIVDPQFGIEHEASYLSFLSNKNLYLSGIGDELRAHNLNFSYRQKVVDTIFYSPYVSSVSASLLKNDIGYIYMRSVDNLFATDSAKFLNKIFQNDEVKILKIEKKEAIKYLKIER